MPSRDSTKDTGIISTTQPSTISSKSSTLLTREQLTFLARLATPLQGVPEAEVLKVLLSQGKEEGLDVASLYATAVQVRPRWWPKAPPLSELLPEE